MSALAQTRTIQPETSVALILAEPSKAISSRDVFTKFKTELEKEVDAHVPDLTTKKGRDAVASLAFRVTKAKTSIDDAGKKLTEDARKQIDSINAERKIIREELEALATRARKPLTDWEIAEDLRIEKVKELKAQISALGVVLSDATSFSVAGAIEALSAIKITEDLFGAEYPIALKMAQTAGANLGNALARIKRDEADKIELARLKAEAAERERTEQERLAAEAKAKTQAEAEAKRIEAELAAIAKREAENREREARAAEVARNEAIEVEQRKAKAEQFERDRAAAEVLAKAEAEKAALQRQIDETAAKAAREKVHAETEAKRKANEDAARAADIEHRGSVMRAVKEAMMAAAPIDEASAKAIVKAIISGAVPHTAIQF